jgi:hypothetical protein
MRAFYVTVVVAEVASQLELLTTLGAFIFINWHNKFPPLWKDFEPGTVQPMPDPDAIFEDTIRCREMQKGCRSPVRSIYTSLDALVV